MAGASHTGSERRDGGVGLQSAPLSAEKAARLKSFLHTEAERLGFCAMAVAPARSAPFSRERLAEFIELGRHGSMQWLAETLDRRADPQTLWPEARSVIVLAMNYGPDRDPLENLAQSPECLDLCLCRNRDYHDIIKGKLKQLAGKFGCASRLRRQGLRRHRAGDGKAARPGGRARLDRQAHQSGQPPTMARGFFLARSLPRSSWRRMLPKTITAAPAGPVSMLARQTRFPRLTRLMRGAAFPISPSRTRDRFHMNSAPPMGNRIYGCDDCLAVCPWNKYAQSASEMKLVARDDLQSPRIADFLALDDAGFRAFFSGSPIKRIGRNRFLRNVLIAAGNSGDQSLVLACEKLLPTHHHSCGAPLSGRCRG
jgi:epoxyqueuosine reductase